MAAKSPKSNVGLLPIETKKIHFVISARDLPMKERGCVGSTLQDPYVKWSQKDTVEPFKQVAVTKHRKNDPNPDFYDTVFSYDWTKGTGQIWHFDVMDYDALNKDDAISSVDVDVDNYVLEKNEELSVKLTTQGTLLLKKCVRTHFRLSAKDLPKLDPLGGLSDPYVQCFWSFGATGPDTLFATTKTIKNTENAVWDERIEFPNYQVGTNQYWTFKVFDKDPLPKDDAIGQAVVEVDNFLKLKNIAFYRLSKDAENIAELIVIPASIDVDV